MRSFLGIGLILALVVLILPSVLGVALPFRRAFYIHWALLHLSLILRVAGDLASSAAARWGGLGNTLAILLFLANSALAVARGKEGLRESD
jgi:hypothetical protein